MDALFARGTNSKVEGATTSFVDIVDGAAVFKVSRETTRALASRDSLGCSTVVCITKLVVVR